jgi:hypothetical protein
MTRLKTIPQLRQRVTRRCPGAMMRWGPGKEVVIPTGAEWTGDLVEAERWEAHTGRFDGATGVA